MNRALRAYLAVILIALATEGECRAGWFFSDTYYVVIQRTSSGVYLNGWITNAMPKNDNGVYVFTPSVYAPKNEMRVSVQNVAIITAGESLINANKIRSQEIGRGKNRATFSGF